MRTTRTILAVTTAAALMSTPALAQHAPNQHSPAQPRAAAQPNMMPMEHGQGGMMDGGMMAMPGGPDMILKLKGSLELTEAQITRLKAIHETAHTGMRAHMMPGMQGMQSAAKMLEAATPDLAAYEAELRKSAEHMVLAHAAMARAEVEARQVLTVPQRERLVLARRMMLELKPVHAMKPMQDMKP